VQSLQYPMARKFIKLVKSMIISPLASIWVASLDLLYSKSVNYRGSTTQDLQFGSVMCKHVPCVTKSNPIFTPTIPKWPIN
jgi:hypothetical protein